MRAIDQLELDLRRWADATFAQKGVAGTGDVTGPSSATDGNLPQFSGTSGKILSDSGIAVSSLPSFDVSSQTRGDVLYFNGTQWVRLGAGTSGEFLQTQGVGVDPQWAAASALTNLDGGAASTTYGAVTGIDGGGA